MPPVAAAPEDEPLRLLLEPAEQGDPDRVPPPLVREVASPEFAPWAGLRGVTATKAGLGLDADGDGRSELNVRAGRSAVVRLPRADRSVRLLLFQRADRWWAAPAGVLRGRGPARPSGLELELLDADLDGRFDGPGDLVRVGADGAFFALAAERRIAWGEDLWRLELVPRAEPPGALEARLAREEHPPGLGAVERRGLAAVNAYRRRVGVAPLALDARWSLGCARHAAYILRHPVQGFGHSESPSLAGFSPEGHEAAVEGVMERTGDPAVAVERLTSMLMHRTPFLTDPVVGLGVGAVSGPAPKGGGGGMGPPGFTVLRAGQALASSALPVFVPGPGQRDVPLTLLPEVPTPEPRTDLYARPRGYAASLSFLARGSPPPVLTLRVAGKPEPVPGVVFTPAAPLHPSFAHNYATAFLVPEEPLVASTTYEVECRLGAPGAERTWIWRFTTRAR